MTTPSDILVRCHVQPTIVTGHHETDDGEMVFLICRRGLHAAMRRGFAVGARPLIRVWLELLEEDSDEPTVAELKRQLADMTEQRDRMHQAINDMAAERFSRQAAGEPQEQ